MRVTVNHHVGGSNPPSGATRRSFNGRTADSKSANASSILALRAISVARSWFESTRGLRARSSNRQDTRFSSPSRGTREGHRKFRAAGNVSRRLGLLQAGVAQSVERRPEEAGVGGPNPSASTTSLQCSSAGSSSALLMRGSGVRAPPLEPSWGAAEKRRPRTVNPPHSETPQVRVLPPRPFHCQSSTDRRVYEQHRILERGATAGTGGSRFPDRLAFFSRGYRLAAMALALQARGKPSWVRVPLSPHLVHSLSLNAHREG